MKFVRLATVLGALALITPIVACDTGSDGGAEHQRGSLEVIGHISSALNQSDVTHVDLQMTGMPGTPAEGASYSWSLSRNGDSWSGVLADIPTGQYQIFGSAYNDDYSVSYGARADGIVVTPGATTSLTLNFHAGFVPTFNNQAPFIETISISNRNPSPGETISLTASATDPDNDPFSYSWFEGLGTFIGPSSGPTVTWQAPPTVGPVDLRITVDDGRGGVSSASVTINVQNAGPTTGSLTVSTTFHDPPVISNLRVDNAQPASGAAMIVWATVSGGTDQCPAAGDPFCTQGAINWFSTCGQVMGGPGPLPYITGDYTTSIIVTSTDVECDVSILAEDKYGGRADSHLFVHPHAPSQQ